ncbi:microtubule-associated protein futsch-like [Haliotis cracherodii]|uniref:microtubule-associated protein futsch-like n=1 Tax=Haliotis cracherodii TaxID=6455 RepID=UPI0039E72EE8
MPRVTRKTLTDSPTPSRMSPRATTKASTTSSRASRSTADSPSPSPGTSTSRSRSSRSRGAEIRSEPEVVDVVTKPTRGRQQKQGEGDDNVVEKGRSRSRAKAKVEEETEEVAAEPARASGRSRSRGKPVEADTDTQKEAANNTSSRSRGKAKAEESNKDKAVAESGRAGRSRVKGPAKTPEEKPAETGRGSRSRSSNNEKAEESTPTNSRSRKGAKQVDNTPEEAAETSQPKSRSRSRGKAAESKSPEVEADTGRRSRGKPVESSVSESVGSSRSSSRSRTPKPAAEDVVEPAVVEDKGRGKSQANGSTRGSRRRSSGKVEDAVPTEDTEMTPPGRRSGRKQVKTEVDQTVTTKKRQSGRKSSTPDNDSEAPMDQTDKQAVVQLTKLRDDEVEAENKSPVKAADEEAMDEEPVDKEAVSGKVVRDTKEEAVSEEKEEIESVPEEESTSEDKVPDEPMGEEKDKAETKDETEVSKPEKIEEKPVEPKEKVTADIKEAVVTKEKLPVPEDKEIDKVDGDLAAAELPSQKTTLPETEPEPIETDKSKISEDIVEEKDEKKEESIVEAMETDEVEESPAKKESAPCNGTMPIPEVPADPEQSPEKQNITVTASHGQKRKLEHDESFEENESKRVCVESPVKQDTEAGDMEVSQPDDKAIEEVESRTSQQPIIEPISDVSSAEEESTPAPRVSIQEPVLAEKSLEPPVESKAPPVAECKESPIEISKEPSVEKSKEPSVEISKEPSVEISKEPSVEINKEPAVESKEAVSGETSHKATEGVTKEEQPKSADEDLTSGYVIISMDDVPPTDSAMVKEALPNHTNQTEVKVPDSRSEEESMEVDGVPAVPEQSKVPAPAAPAAPAVTSDIANGTSQQSSKSDCHPSADSTPVTSQPIDNAKELTKSEPVIPKPLRTFDPSPDIFHRTCVRNPNIDLSSITSSNKFSVASYNILAECHRLKGDYSYTDDKYLEQEFRHQLLLRELEYLDADILCLQEVNPKYYATLLQPALQKSGYEGNLMKRTKEAFDEGEATFVKTSRFSIESSKGVSLADLSKKNINESLNKEVQQAVEEYLDRADVVNVSRLRCKQTNKVVTVGNIHVVWDNFSSPDVQSIQIASAVKELVSQAGSDSSPHFLCGDFNSTATSVGYQLARDGYLSDSNIASLQAVENLKLESGSKALINHLWGAFQHTSSNLNSAYNTCQDGEPEFTTYTSNMLEGVDYIFYGSDGLGAADILRVVDSAVLEETGGIPNQDFPSDHLSLKSTLYFK